MEESEKNIIVSYIGRNITLLWKHNVIENRINRIPINLYILIIIISSIYLFIILLILLLIFMLIFIIYLLLYFILGIIKLIHT